MACYLPDHLVQCLICQKLFSNARRLRCGCVYCYLCCLKLANNYTLYCRCSVVHRFNSQEELEQALVIDTVVNDLVRQHIKQKQITPLKLVDYEATSMSSRLPEDDHPMNLLISSSNISSNIRKQVAVAQPPCSICKKKSSLIILCEHCQCDICELCLENHYQMITDVLQDKWIQCKTKFEQINESVLLSHQNQAQAQSKLDVVRNTIDERMRNLKNVVDDQRQTLTERIDHQVQNLEGMIQLDNTDHVYQSIRERLPKILEEETNTANLAAFLDETKALLQQLINRDKQLKEIELRIPYLSQPDLPSINVSHLIGELKFDDPPPSRTSTANLNPQIDPNDNGLSSLMSIVPERTRFPRRMRPPNRSRAGHGIQHLSQLIGTNPRNNTNHNNGRFRGNHASRGHASSRPRPLPLLPAENHFGLVPNNQHQWSIDFKEIPFFLSVLDNRNRARQPDTRPHHKHDYMLFMADDYGQISVHSLPKANSHLQPSIIGTSELFSKNSRLLLESFTVYEFAIVVYVRRFEQRSNEIEHSKLIKAGLPIMKGEQGRCNDHGGMIYLFSHGGDEIDGIYQAHPIRIILADQIFGRLWALNPMENNVYSYITPNHKNEIGNCLQNEEILLDFSEEQFEPSTMIQSDQCIGLIDSEHDLYRLYIKDEKLRMITTYDHSHDQQWKLTGGVIFKDNRTLLKLTADKYSTNTNDRVKKNELHKHPRCCLIELNPDGQENRRIQANTLYSMTLGPDDELILGFAIRGDRGVVHCY